MKNIFLKNLSLFLSLIIIVPLFASCSQKNSEAEKGKETVITVGDYDVSFDLYNYLFKNFQKDYPDEDNEKIEKRANEALLDMFAIIKTAAKYNIKPDDEYYLEAADNAVQLEKDNTSEEEFEKQLKKNNMTEEVFRFLTIKSKIKDELYYAMINAGDIITDAEKVKEKALTDEFVCVKQVLIKSESSVLKGELSYVPAKTYTDEEAENLASKVRDMALLGEDFDKLIEEYGQSLSVMEGKTVTYVCRGMWEKENEDAVFSLECDGDISDVAVSSMGYSIFKRCPKNASDIDSFIESIVKNYSDALFNSAIEETRSSLKTEKTDNYNKLFVAD